ncbi:MAG TPA: ketol-acid reductoisomerase, partial [Micromonosporaceae bacterium]|nr:ketol-acid reductoisomerase [Micromonosporaceae bacterium]
MTAEVYYDDDADLSLIQNRSVAVVGDGGHGLAQALCLRDSGVDVVVGLAGDAPSRARAQEEGLRVMRPADAAAAADVVMVLAPEGALPALYSEAVAPHLAAGKALLLGSGFAVRYGLIRPPGAVDVAVVAPTGPADLVRRQYVDGKGVPVLIGVPQDASGDALALALSYAKALGGTRGGAVRTTIAEQTEANLFGGQAVLGGVAALVRTGFEVLTEAGYGPEVVYLACLHDLKSVVDRTYAGGLAQM